MSAGRSQLHTPGIISDYFAMEGHLLSTRSADAYKAVDKSRNTSICLWLMKHPLARESAAVRRFLARMEEIDAIVPPVTRLSSYGVDADGIAFCLLPPLDGFVIGGGNLEATEAERRFISALRLVDRLHQHGIMCGDICGSSFWIDRAGDVGLIGLMGSFDSEAVATAMLPPVETIPFVAPEQTAGGAEPASDVFALGVLGYYLLTHAYPYGQGAGLMAAERDISRVKPLSQFLPIPPLWAEEVLFACLSPDPSRRYPDAGAVLKSISDIRQRSFAQERVPAVRGERGASLVGAAPKREGPGAGTSQPAVIRAAQMRIPSQMQNRPEAPRGLSGLRKALMLLCGAVVVLLGVQIVSWFWDRHPGEAAPDLTGDGSDPTIEIRDLGKEKLDEQQFQVEVDRLRDSDDPVSHLTLINTIKKAKSPEYRRIVEKALLERARRLGTLRAVEQVKNWLRKVKEPGPAYEAVLMTLDRSVPAEERDALLRQAYSTEPELVLRLTAALALDSGAIEQYQPILAQLVGDALDIEGAGDYSGLALIMAHYQLALIFGDDIVQNRDKLSNRDLQWLLRILAERGDINTRAIANLAVQRGVLPPLRAALLKIVRDKSDLPPEALAALIRAAGGALQPEDVGSFGRWYDPDAERILLAILADSTDAKVRLEAFDVLAGKSPTIEPSASVVEWVRRRHWKNREHFTRLVGLMAFLDSADLRQLEEAFAAMDQEQDLRDLAEILLDTQHPMVMKMVLERYPDRITLGRKLSFLSASSKDLRKAAILSIQTNDAGALKIVSDNYARERDPELLELYKQRFEMIAERAPR